MRGRKFGRMPNHRLALMRNLATSLMEHQRITTTLEKAKEVRPLIEKLIHKAKKNDAQAQIFMNKTLFTNSAIRSLQQNIAPRFKSLPAGFTRIEYIGNRSNDRSKTAMIELIDNPQSQFEKNEEAVEKDSNGLKSFWEWEQGLLENEELYWEGKLRNLKDQIK